MGSREGYKGFRIALRDDWEDIKVQVMERIVWEKFCQNTDLGHRLLATGDCELIEGNRWSDRFWGVDLMAIPAQGENWLGRLLMLTRAKLGLVADLGALAAEIRTCRVAW